MKFCYQLQDMQYDCTTNGCLLLWIMNASGRKIIKNKLYMFSQVSVSMSTLRLADPRTSVQSKFMNTEPTHSGQFPAV